MMMMKVHFFLFLLLLNLGFSLFSNHPFVHGDANLVSDYCKQTTIPVLCETCMFVDSKSAESGDLKFMIMMLFRCSLSRAQTTKATLEHMAMDNTTDPNLAHGIDDCVSNYFAEVYSHWTDAYSNLISANYTAAKVKAELGISQSYMLGCLERIQNHPNVTVPTQVMMDILEYLTIGHAASALIGLL